MNVNVKLIHPDAKMPTKAHSTDAGFDLTAVSINETDLYIEYDTGIAIQIPDGHAGFLFPRSSVSNQGLNLANSIGLIDQNFRGTIKARFNRVIGLHNPSNEWEDEWDKWIHAMANPYKVGDRIAQLVIQKLPEITLIEADELTETDRGDNGYGSTGC